jgi:type I restriction enzyme, S subunit
MKWEYVNLGEVAEFKNGLNFSKDQYGQGVKYISVADFQDYFSAKTDGLAELKEDFINPSYFLKEGDILFVRSNGNKELVGRNLFIDNTLEPLTFSGFCIRARFIKEDVLPKFYAYLFKSKFFRNTLSANAGGTNINNLNQSILSNLNIPKPPLPTQRKIASILSAYDDLIENNLKRIKLLEEKAFVRYKQIVMEEKMDEFFIEEICETLGGGTPATGDRRFWDEGEILWFSPTDLTKHHSIVLLDSAKKITELGLQKSSAKLVPPKTILMTSRASIGYFGLINKPASTNQGFINIIPFNEKHRAYMLFDLKNRKEEIIGNANGSTFLEISKSKFRQMKIKLPEDEKILIEFETEFETLFNLIENLLKQNTKLREARDILLPKLMNGQIEV